MLLIEVARLHLLNKYKKRSSVSLLLLLIKFGGENKKLKWNTKKKKKKEISLKKIARSSSLSTAGICANQGRVCIFFLRKHLFDYINTPEPNDNSTFGTILGLSLAWGSPWSFFLRFWSVRYLSTDRYTSNEFSVYKCRWVVDINHAFLLRRSTWFFWPLRWLSLLLRLSMLLRRLWSLTSSWYSHYESTTWTKSKRLIVFFFISGPPTTRC